VVILTGYAPWIGTGSMSSPYTIQPTQISWQAAAEPIIQGYTCWDPETGFSKDLVDGVEGALERSRAYGSATRVMTVPSGCIGSIRLPEPGAEAALINRFQVVSAITADTFEDQPLDDFFAFFELCHAIGVFRLCEAYPLLDWSDPIVAAMLVLDDLRLGDDESQRLWSHYRDVFTPERPTPDAPAEIYLSSEQGHRYANVERCRELLEVPDDLANPVRRSEICYWVIVGTEVLTALAVEG